MQTEYALMRGMTIITAVTSSRSLDEMRRRYPDYAVKVLDTLPPDVLANYPYWRERP